MTILCSCGTAEDKAQLSARSEMRLANQRETAQEIKEAELSNGESPLPTGSSAGHQQKIATMLG